MSDIKNLLELNKVMNKSDTLQNDFTEAMTLVKNMFQRKYISKLSDELEKQKIEHKKNPSKEIQLIQAVKPFINQSRHKEIDSITDTLINISTLLDIQKSFIENSEEQERKKEKDESEQKVASMSVIVTEDSDTSIKKDGIYDIDENCYLIKQSRTTAPNQNNFLYIILIFLLFSNKQF